MRKRGFTSIPSAGLRGFSPGQREAWPRLAPILAIVRAIIGFAVIPFGPDQTIDVFGITVKPFVISDINIGILYILAFASIRAY